MEHRTVAFFLIGLLACPVGSLSAEKEWGWISTILMKSTFKIIGKDTEGTAFILGVPLLTGIERGSFVLVTAAHVLQNISGDQATLVLRKQESGGGWKRLNHPLRIRSGGSPLWTQHPTADVAAMYVMLPTEADVRPVSIDALASDTRLEQADLRPGDVLLSLGYPFGNEANPAGFPILRSGRIASYPLLPSKITGTFLLDFQVFPGNSGGPVFLMEPTRTVRGELRGGDWQFVVGLVSKERLLSVQSTGPFRTTVERYSLGLGEVVPASLIQETIGLMPSRK